ncbi:D-2-hydroxyacid dehydrogenase [Halorientalis brevis]|uniref:D-2-hydroxyacid dehydrogenase n=1 Tax=Halorientalis brevis TaxID=1126241 RepID=A0ABD6CG67_9EURY
MTDSLEIVVLGEKFHGLPPGEYAAALREQLPDHQVRVAKTPDRARALLETADVATGSDIDPSMLDAAEDLRLFACAYAGYGHLPLDELRDHDVAVTTASGVHGPNVAEQVLGYCLTFARRLDEGWRRKQRREWRSYPTSDFAGSTVGIVGLGAIGQAIVDRLDGFDVDTIGVRHSPEKGGPTDKVLGYGDIHEALARSEYLVLCCPLTIDTRGLIDETALQTLPTDAVVVNVARGEIVDTDALVSALRHNRIRGAALDVTDPEPLPEDHPLWGFENVQITPHNAGFTPAYHDRLAAVVAENVDRIVETGEYEGLRNQVT